MEKIIEDYGDLIMTMIGIFAGMIILGMIINDMKYILALFCESVGCV